jgi:hypothetical protein
LVSSGFLDLADDTDLAVGFSVDAGTEDEFVTVRFSGEIYAQASGAILAGERVQADATGAGTVGSGTGLTGRMLGIALSDEVGGLVHVAIGPFDVDVVAGP